MTESRRFSEKSRFITWPGRMIHRHHDFVNEMVSFAINKAIVVFKTLVRNIPSTPTTQMVDIELRHSRVTGMPCSMPSAL